ncbi:MAG: ABC transporter permease subunit [Planctomycetes bacterium]|nr:ABC transporter permease subunit [Planctomycetota bacterium]MCB9886039.1 ABC transporter permease subunit [Planctomycetota bacterium]
MRELLAAAFAALSVVALPGQSSSAPAAQRFVVASKNFTESAILAEMIALTVAEHTALQVEHKTGLGGTMICFEALRQGDIDCYPDYTGTGWAIVLKEPAKISDPLRAFTHVQRRYRELYDIEWMAPFGLQNSYALAMREAQADALGVVTISDLVAHAPELRAAFSIEFHDREDGWAGLRAHYGLRFAEVRPMEHGLAYEALAGEVVDVIDAYTTDGKLPRYHLRTLRDDRGFFPPYHAAPLVRGEVLRAHPELRTALGRLAYVLDDATMTGLNYEVEEKGRMVRDVAREFLQSRDVLGPGGVSRPEVTRSALLPFLWDRRWQTLWLIGEHLYLSLLAVLLAAAFAVPLGIAIRDRRFAERLALGAAGVVQTIPSLALLMFLIAIPGFGLSERSAIFALFLYALLPILRNTVTGLRGVDPVLVDAATGIGLTPAQILRRVQLPLAVPTIMAGVRTATVIGIGVATLAAFIGAGGLGGPIVQGLYLNDVNLILAGAIPAALLALLADRALGFVERRLAPKG